MAVAKRASASVKAHCEPVSDHASIPRYIASWHPANSLVTIAGPDTSS